jgi:hypothetical protein
MLTSSIFSAAYHLVSLICFRWPLRTPTRTAKLELATPIPTKGFDGFTDEHFDDDTSEKQSISHHRSSSNLVPQL